MANKSVFATICRKAAPARLTPGTMRVRRLMPVAPQALAQLAVTGTFNATFYAEPREQLDEVLKLAWQVEPEFLARTRASTPSSGAT